MFEHIVNNCVYVDGCVYGGNVYTQGQTWDDGCTYTCECLDASTGRYRCTEKLVLKFKGYYRKYGQVCGV
jgi:hypothetical protein